MAFLVPAPGLDLARTLDCGQAFRWRCSTQSGSVVARGVVKGAVLTVRARSDVLAVTARGAVDAQSLAKYFMPWGPLRPLENRLARDPVLRRHLPRTAGISILGQDPWEALATFVISQNNNIPKIRLSIQRLCDALGTPLHRSRAFAFPTAAAVADAPSGILASAALGYRVPYLRAAARFAAERSSALSALTSATIEDARAALLELPGVGNKVADCVLLFGFGRGEAFPVDVWVRRAVQTWYFRGRRRSDAEIRAFARDRYGDLAGLAQQHLFWAARSAARGAGGS